MIPFHGLRVVEDPRMMQGAYFFKDGDGRILAAGHTCGWFFKSGNTDHTTQVVCSTAAYQAIQRQVPAA